MRGWSQSVLSAHHRANREHAGGGLDFAVAGVVLLGLLVFYRVPFGWNLLLIPVMSFITLLASIGVSLWLAAFNVKYRDFMYALPFIIQVWMYASPVAYSTDLIPKQWQTLYALNPLVGLIDGFRWAVLGNGEFPIMMVASATAMAVLAFVSGSVYFHRVERTLADVI
jgi:lipopolysaccharide transport system permease protein